MSSCVQIHILHINRAYFAGDAGKEKTLALYGSARPVGYFHPQNSDVSAKFERKSGNPDPSAELAEKILGTGVANERNDLVLSWFKLT